VKGIQLKLKVNEDKSKTAKSDQVKFLGMTIVKTTIAISKAAFLLSSIDFQFAFVYDIVSNQQLTWDVIR
jgi:hypothetical protein